VKDKDATDSLDRPIQSAGARQAAPNGILWRSQDAARIREGIRRIRHLVRKEFIQIVRNRQNFIVLLIAPLFQLFLFGYACRLDVQNVLTVVVDQDRSALSREVIKAFSRSGYFTIVGSLDRYDQVDGYMQKEYASMALLIPSDLEQRIRGGRTAEVGVLIDGVDTVTAGTVSGYAQSILKQFAVDITSSRINKMQ